MHVKQIAEFLVDGAAKEFIQGKLQVVLNRMVLAILSAPSLAAYTVDTGIKANADGSATLEFEFLKLPEEVVPQVERLLSTHYFGKPKWTRFVRDSSARMGLQIQVKPDDIPGSQYDYSY